MTTQVMSVARAKGEVMLMLEWKSNVGITDMGLKTECLDK